MLVSVTVSTFITGRGVKGTDTTKRWGSAVPDGRLVGIWINDNHSDGTRKHPHKVDAEGEIRKPDRLK